MKLTLEFFVSQLLTSHDFSLFVEQFWHIYWISYCKKCLASKGDIISPWFCYKFFR